MPLDPQPGLEQQLIDSLAAAKDSLERSGLVVGKEIPAAQNTIRSALLRRLRLEDIPAGQTAIRSAFLRRFLLELIPNSKLPIARVEIHGAELEGELDLGGTNSGLLLIFVDCVFAKGINISDAQLAGLSLRGCDVKHLQADRADIKGPLAVRYPDTDDHSTHQTSTIGAKLRLNGATVHGNLDLRGCRIDGEIFKGERTAIFADGLTVEGNVLLADGFSAHGEVRLNGCKLSRNLDCSGATLNNPEGNSLSAAGGKIEGSALFCHTHRWGTYRTPREFVSQGVLGLENAQITGNLDCSGGMFSAPCFSIEKKDWKDGRQPSAIAINANGLHVDENLHLRGSQTDNDETPILLSVKGQVSLIAAFVGADFICTDATFEFPAEDCLVADGITVVQATYLGRNLGVDGYMRFIQATLKGGVYADDITFDRAKPHQFEFDYAQDTIRSEIGDGCGIYAALAELGGTFYWKNIRRKTPPSDGDRPLWLFLEGARTDRIDDAESAWRVADRFDITGCSYSTIESFTGDIGWRLQQLDREYAPLNPDPACGWSTRLCQYVWLRMKACGLAIRRTFRLSPAANPVKLPPGERVVKLVDAVERFKPQPYQQLAKIVGSAGYADAARKILVRVEDNKTIYGDLGFLRFSARVIVGFAIQYGLASLRPLWILAAWALISAATFEYEFHQHEIVPTKDNAQAISDCSRTLEAPAPAADHYVCFNALTFSLETLVPLVDLDQKKNWSVQPMRDDASLGNGNTDPIGWPAAWWRVICQIPDTGAGRLYLLNMFVGAALWAFAVAGLTGLVRASSDSE
ncbi:MAG: hypothetical protein ABSD74_13820 [Rhizomicrobium sp.]|jgi:uncharacterized protein YjbI with pentapeptide repeats